MMRLPEFGRKVSAIVLLILCAYATGGSDAVSEESLNLSQESTISVLGLLPERQAGLVFHRLVRSRVYTTDGALGDVNQDGEINLIDLLRIRDISVAYGAAPTPSELSIANLNGNHAVDVGDALYVRDIVLGSKTVPYVIGQKGGTVLGPGAHTAFVIPPNALTGDRRVTVQEYDQSTIEADLVSTIGSWGSGSQFMAGTRLTFLDGTAASSQLPSGTEMYERVTGTPDMTGGNGAFGIGPDLNQDGQLDVSYLGSLQLTNFPVEVGSKRRAIDEGAGAAAMVLVPPPNRARPIVTEIVRADVDPFSLMVRDTTAPLEPGAYLFAYGSDWQDKRSHEFRLVWRAASDSVSMPLLTVAQVSIGNGIPVWGAVSVVPVLEAGMYEVVLYDQFFDRTFAPVQVTVTTPSVPIPVGLKDSSLVNAARCDSILTWAVGREPLESEFPNLKDYVSAIRDSVRVIKGQLEGVPSGEFQTQESAQLWAARERARVREWWEAAQRLHEEDMSSAPLSTLGLSCYERCMYIQAAAGGASAVAVVGLTSSIVAACLANPGCRPGLEITARKAFEEFKRMSEEFCSQRCEDGPPVPDGSYPDPLPRPTPTPGVDPEPLPGPMPVPTPAPTPYDNGIVCIHWDGRNDIATYHPDVAPRPTPTPLNGKSREEPNGEGEYSTRPLPAGSIVYVQNAPIPASRGVVDRLGAARIPFNVLSGEVTLGAYDPFRGVVDADVGRVVIADPATEHRFVEIAFQPDTTIATHTLTPGSYVDDMVVPGAATKVFTAVLGAEAAATGVSFDFGAAGPLRFEGRFDDVPFVVSVDTQCEKARQLVFNKAGTLSLRVGLGTNGVGGAFTLGLTTGRRRASPIVCGAIDDTLSEQAFLEYRIQGVVQPAVMNTVRIGSGVSIIMDVGSELLGTGGGFRAQVPLGHAPVRIVRGDSVAGERKRGRVADYQIGRVR